MVSPGKAQWRILVVDDDPLVCDSIRWIFAPEGHQVVTALSGQAALAQFQTGRFDAIVLDYKMPDMDGDEVAAALKSLGANQPIVIVTAYPEAVASLGRPLTGVDLVIPKPFGPEQLRQALTAILSKRQSVSPNAMPPPPPPPPGDADKS